MRLRRRSSIASRTTFRSTARAEERRARAARKIINNPFWWSADDKFFNYALATKLGVAIPPTVLLPHKEHPTGTTERSMRNLHYPLDWDAIFEYVGFPAFLKPFDGGGWRDVYKVNNREEFFTAYDQTRTLCMTLQAAVELQGILPLLRRRAGEGAHHALRPARAVPRALRAESAGVPDRRCSRASSSDALTLCRALGYDLNTVEFAVEDGIPYAIDFMNPAPDADLHSVGQANFDWIVERASPSSR